MKFRVQAFFVHLLASIAVLCSALTVLYYGWYAWPGWYLAGAELIVALMVLVDIGVGPLATLVIADSRKPARKLRLDFSLVIGVQIVALLYGVNTLWNGRPVYYVFSGNSITQVTASSIEPTDRELSVLRNMPLALHWHSTVQYASTKMPEDPEEFKQLLLTRLLAGQDIVYMPQYYQSFAADINRMREFFVDEAKLVAEVAIRIRSYILDKGLSDRTLGILPVQGRMRTGTFLVDATSGDVVGFVDVRTGVSAAKKNAPPEDQPPTQTNGIAERNILGLLIRPE